MSNVYSEAFDVWKNAHAQFKTALKVYSDACSVFCALCSGPLVQDTTRSMLKDVLNALDSELLGLASDIQPVRSANKILKLLRNKCPTAVPINMLPAELLNKIFELLCCSYEKLDKTDQPLRFPWTLAWVNTYWRQLAVGNSRLWTHIHILVTLSKRRGKVNEQAQAQLKYTRKLPLDVMLDATRYLAPAKDNFLIRVVPRLRSLAYRSGYSDTCFPSDALSPWFRQGTPGACYCLKLQSHGLVQQGDLRLNIQSSSTSLKRIEAFLAPIRYLTLHNHYIGWSSTLYHGLIELNLNFNSSFIYDPTATEFAAILSASPGLRALKLHGLGLRPQEGLDAVEPIHLNHLEVLFLGNIYRSADLLFSMIQPGSTPLYMRFDVPILWADRMHYIQLLPRCRVMKLVIVGNGYYLPIQDLLACLKGVQHLCLCNCILDIAFWMSMREPVMVHDNQQYPSIWPSLRTLHLYQCGFLISVSDRLLYQPIPYRFMLWIWGGDQYDEMDRSLISRGSLNAQTILRSLSRYVPGMQKVQDDEPILLEAWGSALDFAPYSKQ